MSLTRLEALQLAAQLVQPNQSPDMRIKELFELARLIMFEENQSQEKAQLEASKRFKALSCICFLEFLNSRQDVIPCFNLVKMAKLCTHRNSNRR